jgi:hypothetical protein
MPAGGTLYLTIAGVQRGVTGDFSVKVGGPKREPIPGLSGAGLGYSETMEDGEIDCTLVTTSAVRCTDVMDLSGVAASLKLANGREYHTDQLYYREGDAVDPVKGTWKVKFGCIGQFREV